MSPELRLQVRWQDVDLLQLQVSVQTSQWAGSAPAYVTREELLRFAEELEAVAANACEATLDAGQRDLGWADLHVYEYGGARHLALSVELGFAADAIVGYAHGNHFLRAAAGIERGPLAPFAAALRRMAHESVGEGALPLLSGQL